MASTAFITPVTNSVNFRAINGASAVLCSVGLLIMAVNYEWFAFGYASTHFLVLSALLHTLAAFNYEVWDAVRVATAGLGIGIVMLQTTFLQVSFPKYYLEWVGAHPQSNTALQEVVVIVLAPILSTAHVIGTRPVRVALLLLLSFGITSFVFLMHEVIFAASPPANVDRSLTTTSNVIALYLSGMAMMFGTSLGIEAIIRCTD